MIVDKLITGYLAENCYILSKKNDILIIDPGDDIKKIIKKINGRNVLAILITHYHFDHIGALNELLSIYNCPVIDYKWKDKLIKIKDFSFKISRNKGHSNDSISFYFEKENIMFVGDFIFRDSVGRWDLEGGSKTELIKSIKKLSEINSNPILFPGHGEKTTLEYEKKNNIFFKY